MVRNNVYIARHGLTEWNKTGRIQGQANDLKLTAEGIAQMNLLGKFLAEKEENYIVILSPMKRVQESFEIVDKYLNIINKDIYTLDELKEMNFGDFEWKLKSEVNKSAFFDERENNKWETRYPNGESYSELFVRL